VATADAGASPPSASSAPFSYSNVPAKASATAGIDIHSCSPLRCSPAGAADPLSSAAAARAYTDYYLAAFAANVCECIAAAARANKALLQQTHMRALTEGFPHRSCPPSRSSRFISAVASHVANRCRRDLRALANCVRARVSRCIRCAY
jgi:hypothetical protein